jgi:hypothetical protein
MLGLGLAAAIGARWRASQRRRRYSAAATASRIAAATIERGAA